MLANTRSDRVSTGQSTRVRMFAAVGTAVAVVGLLVFGARLIARGEAANEDLERQAWRRNSLATLNGEMAGVLRAEELCQMVIRTVTQLLDAPIGAFYVRDGGDRLICLAGHGTESLDSIPGFSIGEGLVGRAAAEGNPVFLDDVPGDYLAIRSGLGATPPRQLVIQPTTFEGTVNGVFEVATHRMISVEQREFLERAATDIGVVLATSQSRERLQELLEETQVQSEELQAQLEGINAELEERTEALQREAQRTARKNSELALARDQVELKAQELEEMSRYKSEFLANMSHELRTPLNSILLLSRLLAENGEGTLSAKQVEFAQTVHDSGNELITLIDEILDQARIESGKLKLVFEPVALADLLDGVERQFKRSVEEKGLTFDVHLDSRLPATAQTDDQRLRQILKNLLSNALKFTETGGITVKAAPANEKSLPEELVLREEERFIELSVRDTGIGIAREMQQRVFEPFQQAEGSTDRKYGGTGLGLSISQKLAELLGGTLALDSEPGRGSCFSLLIPTTPPADAEPEEQTIERASDSVSSDGEVDIPELDDPAVDPATDSFTEGAATPADTADDRDDVSVDDRAVLIIEDDPVFSSLLTLLARERGFKVLSTNRGKEGIELARQYQPSAILLDIGLPDIDGIAVIGRLKEDLAVRHIPVHFISSHERNIDALKTGAVGYLRKPVSHDAIGRAFSRIEAFIARPVSRLLVAVIDPDERDRIVNAIGGKDVELTTVEGGQEALDAIHSSHFDCAVLQWDLPDMAGKEVLLGVRRTAAVSNLPIVVLSNRELARDEMVTIDRYADRHIIRDDRTKARLLDETALFLHRVEADLPEDQRRVMHVMHDREALFKDRKLLLVDDDMRNVFALCALLESQGLEPAIACNGIEALEKLDELPDTDLVLMDIMMPEMDGYEAMRRIRTDGRFDKLPIIALTAKAMRGDRARCIEAGASDYLTKPVDDDKLLSMLRVWLYS